MLLRYSPFALIWLVGFVFIGWLVIAPRVADPRYWQVDAVDIKLGSTAVFNPYDENENTLGSAAQKPADPHLEETKKEETGLAPISALPDDGVRINALNAELQEDGTRGPIPRISGERAPWQYYARPFPVDDARPRIAIIVKDMGLSEAGLKDALASLPGAVSFAFSPYADNLTAAMQSARDRGHETLLQLPLEVPPGSTQDVGTEAISAAQTSAVNQDNLFKLLAQMLGTVGVITDGGQRMVNNESMMLPLMQNIQGRGLLMVDDTQQNETLSPLIAEQIQMPWARSLLQLDDSQSKEALDGVMQQAVDLAKSNSRVVIVADASPLSRSVIANWASKLERAGIALAPVSAVVTIGSAGQAAPLGSLPEQAPPPDVMTDRAAEEDAAPVAEEPDTGPVNLLNTAPSSAAPNTSVPNILDPAKSAPAH